MPAWRVKPGTVCVWPARSAVRVALTPGAACGMGTQGRHTGLDVNDASPALWHSEGTLPGGALEEGGAAPRPGLPHKWCCGRSVGPADTWGTSCQEADEDTAERRERRPSSSHSHSGDGRGPDTRMGEGAPMTAVGTMWALRGHQHGLRKASRRTGPLGEDKACLPKAGASVHRCRAGQGWRGQVTPGRREQLEAQKHQPGCAGLLPQEEARGSSGQQASLLGMQTTRHPPASPTQQRCAGHRAWCSAACGVPAAMLPA